MLMGNRAVAWFLILIMILEPALGIGWVFAEEEGSQPVQAVPRARKRAVSPSRAVQPDATQPSRSGKSVAETATEPGQEKFLTRLSSEKVDHSENARQSARQAYANLAAGESQWTENLDILGPDDTSPVLQDSIFGSKGKERITLIADDIEAKSLMDRFATEFRLNIVSKAISDRKKVKATLYDLPLETVFQVLLEQANLTYEKRNGIFYLQEKGKGEDAFLTERFFKLKEYADFKFASSLINEIALTKGAKVIANEPKRTFFIMEYERNLKKIAKVLNELGYLEDLDPDASTLYYHYLSFSYVDQSVVKEVIEKYKSQDGEYTIDEKSNRYIVFDSRARFEKMKQALTFVDVPRGQVFIDVLFVDLTRSDSEKLGVDTVMDWNPGSPDNADQLVTTLATDVTNFFSYKQPSHLTNIKVTGFNERSKSNILNNPKLMVLNNEKAVIDVTEKFPFVTNENQSGVISSKIENVDIGVKLDVMPKINANGEVEMEVKPTITVLKEVKNIITKVVDTNQANSKVTETSSEFPITDQRSIDTKVVVPSGRTLVIGGLIKETDRKVADHIPGLAKLPILGPLFRRKSDGEEKSQLYIFITPNIVRQAPQSTAFSAVEDKNRLAFLGENETLPMPSKSKGLTIERSGEKKGSKAANVRHPEKNKVKDSVDDLEEAGNGDQVDFSQFLKKIATLKERQRVDSLQTTQEKMERKTREEGFENLIEQLKEDIYTEKEESSSTPIQVPASVDEPSQIKPAKEVSTRDHVLSERAQRISKLLEKWESDPVDGAMLEEDKTLAEQKQSTPEVIREEPPQPAQREQRPVQIPVVESFPEPVTEPVQPPVATPVERAPEPESSPPVQRNDLPKSSQDPILDIPELEEGISLELISPLGDPGKSKLVPGTFQTGTPPRSGNLESDGSSSSNSKKKPKRRKRPRKKVSYFNSSFDLDLNKMDPVGGKKAKDSSEKRRNGRESVSPALKIAVEASAEPSWESEFFEKNLAHVTIAEVKVYDSDEEAGEAVRDIMKEELMPPSQRVYPKREIDSVVETAHLQESTVENLELEGPESSPVSKEPAPVVVSSSDSRTQAIFDNLLKPNSRIPKPMGRLPKKQVKKVKVSSPDPQTRKIFKDLFPDSQRAGVPAQSDVPSPPINSSMAQTKTEPRVVKKEEQSEKEREFESFLKSMFDSPGETGKKSVKKPGKEPRLIPNKEREFMEFLDSL